jgi:hypothetical protein
MSAFRGLDNVWGKHPASARRASAMGDQQERLPHMGYQRDRVGDSSPSDIWLTCTPNFGVTNRQNQ